MTILTGFKNIFRRRRAKGSSARRGVNSLLLSCTNAMAVATVYRCVKLIGDSVASMPIEHLERRGGIFVPAKDSRLTYMLNVAPNRELSAFDFWRAVSNELVFDGNAYIVPVYSPVTWEIESLVLCGRGTVSHDTVNNIYTVNDFNMGISGTYAEEDILHIKGMTLSNPKVGVSVLTYARQTLGIAAAGDAETHKRFSNGGRVRGILSNDTGVRGFGEYADKELARLAKELNQRVYEDDITSVPGDVKLHQLGMTSADMQFLESRKFTVLEICRFFGVPPTFVYADTSNNYKSVEQANMDFLSGTLTPILRNIETELRRKLVSPKLAADVLFRFDRRALHSIDADAQTRYRQGLLQSGWTVNEVRRLQDLPPVEGGDKALISANLKEANEDNG